MTDNAVIIASAQDDGPGRKINQIIRDRMAADGLHRRSGFVRCRLDDPKRRYILCIPGRDPVGIALKNDKAQVERARWRQRETMRRRGTAIVWFVDAQGVTIAANETDQPTAPQSVRVRSYHLEGSQMPVLCVLAGMWTRAENETPPPDITAAIIQAQAEAVTLTRRGYRPGVVCSPARFQRFMEAAAARGSRMSMITRNILEAHLLWGVPLRTACRHFLRQHDGNEPPERRVENLALQVRRAKKRLMHPIDCAAA